MIRTLLNELPAEVEKTIMTLAEQLIAKGIEETLIAITLINEGTNDTVIMQQTGLDLKIIQTLRKKILH